MSMIRIFALELKDYSRKVTMQLNGWRDLDNDDPFILEADLDQWRLSVFDASRLSLAARDIYYRLAHAERTGTRPEAGPRFQRELLDPDGGEPLIVQIGIITVGKQDLPYFMYGGSTVRLAPEQGPTMLRALARFGQVISEIRRATKRQNPPPSLETPWFAGLDTHWWYR